MNTYKKERKTVQYENFILFNNSREGNPALVSKGEFGGEAERTVPEWLNVRQWNNLKPITAKSNSTLNPQTPEQHC